MLQIVRLKHVLQDTKTSVSFFTYEDNVVDIAKKFIKKTPSDNTYYFTKKSIMSDDNCVTYIYLDKLYIIEAKDSHAITAGGQPILMVSDIMSFHEIEAYDKASGIIKETSRGAW